MFAHPSLYLYALASFSNGLFISLRGPMLPALAARLGCESTALGGYLGLAGVAGGVFAAPTGLILDRPKVNIHSVGTTDAPSRTIMTRDAHERTTRSRHSLEKNRQRRPSRRACLHLDISSRVKVRPTSGSCSRG